jgi:hypothetical protein
MLTQSEIVSRINEVKTSQAVLNEDIQELCINVIGHAMQHGDVTLGDRLLDATKGSNQKAIMTYLKTFGPFSLDAEMGTFKLNKKFRNEHVFNEQALTDGVKWYNFVPSKKQVMASFDLGKRLISLIKQAKEKKAEGQDVVAYEAISYLETAIAKYNSDLAEARRTLAEKGSSNDEPGELSDAEGPSPVIGRTGTEG